jgi:hypothetical protein
MWVQGVAGRRPCGQYRVSAGSRKGVRVRTKSLVQLPEITENHDDSGCMVKSQPCKGAGWGGKAETREVELCGLEG